MKLAPPVYGARICSEQYEIRVRETYTTTHLGIDLCADCGTPIHSPLPGFVKDVHDTDLGGHTIVIQHRPNLFTRYAHCKQILLRPGAAVTAGDKVALVGNTGTSASGRAYGCHLHFAATNVWVPLGTRIYREEDHYNLRTLLDGIGIVESDRQLVWKHGYPKTSDMTAVTALAGAAVLFVIALHRYG